jgi:hypothetical protein
VTLFNIGFERGKLDRRTSCVRAVLTRSDLGKAIIDGANFSDAVLDLQQKLVSFSKFCGASSAYERLPNCNACLGFLCHFISVV